MSKFICLITLLVITIRSFAQSGITGNSSFCQGGNTVLTAPSGNTYQWQQGTSASGPWLDLPGENRATYTATSTGFYQVTVNGTDTYSIYVAANPKPVADFSFTGNNTCSGTSIQFNGIASGGTAPYQYAWKFDDNATSAAASLTRSFNKTGCGTATAVNELTITDANGCSATVTHNLTILSKPEVSLADNDIYNPFSNCHNAPTAANPNYTLKVNSTSASCISSYTINWGDGNIQTGLTSTSFPLSHTYTRIGAFNLVITGLGSNGCSNTQTYTVANQSNPAGGLGTNGSTTNLCAPADVPFVISNWENNSDGTTYKLDFGDGTDTTLNHPLSPGPGSYTKTHRYLTSSCSKGGSSYTATLTAINACDKTPYTAGNIQIRIQPTAAFIIPSTICVDKNLCPSNSTINGYTGSNCATTATYSWNFGDPGSSDNISTSASPCHKYATPGIYTITLNTSNPCGTSTASHTICVVAPPAPSFTLDKITGCAPLNVTTTNTSSTSSLCSTPVYAWSVTYSPGNCGSSSSYNYTNGTSASSQNPSFSFTNAGTYTIKLSITNDCGTVTETKNVTVTKPPAVVINNITSICEGGSISPSANVTNCGTGMLSYTWAFPNGTPASATTANPGIITYATAGPQTVTLSVMNECGTTTETRSFTVNPNPIITVPADEAFCTGVTAGPFTFSSSPLGILSWTNSNNNIGLASSGNGGRINSFTTRNNSSILQTATINVTSSLNSCIANKVFIIRVYPPTATPIVASPVNYCVNETASPLTATGLTGNSLLWYTSSSGAGGITSPPVPSTAIAGIYDYYVSQVSGTGACESPRTNIRVVVNSTPVFTATASNPTLCGTANGSITLSGLTNNTSYSVAYNKNGTPVNATFRTNGSGMLTINNLPAGLYEHIIVTATGCGSTEAGPFTLSEPGSPATPVIVTNSPLCSGNTLTLSATTNSTGPAQWTWTGPGGYTSSSASISRPNATLNYSGDYTVTATINNCVSAPAVVNVTVNPSPAIPAITHNSPLCTGATLDMSITSATGVDYIWSGPAGFSQNSNSVQLLNITQAQEGTYAVTAKLGTCTATSRASVTVNIAPVIASANATNPSGCQSATGYITLEGLSLNAVYTAYYTSSSSTYSKSVTVNSSGKVIIANLPAGTYSNVYLSAPGCSSAIHGPFTIAEPSAPAPPVIAPNNPQCAGTTLQLSATSSTTGTIQYNWTGPNGFTSNQQQPFLTNIQAANAGNYSVTATLNNCVSVPANTTITVNPLPAPPAVTTPVSYCQDVIATPLLATATGSNTLQWYANASGGTAGSTAPTPNTNTPGIASYYVSQLSSFGCEGARTRITVNVQSDARASFAPALNTNCAPFRLTAAIVHLQTNPVNAVYEWYANDISIGSGTIFPGYTITGDNDSVTIKLKTIAASGCKNDSTSHRFYTYPLPKPSFTVSTNSGCGPLAVQVNNTTSDQPAWLFKWNFGNGTTSTATQPGSILFQPSPAYGDTTYTITLYAYKFCDTIQYTQQILVKSKPKALFTPTQPFGCSPFTNTFINTSKGYSTGYIWNFDDGSTRTTTTRDTVQHRFITGVQDTFHVTLATANECGTDQQSYAVVVSPNAIRLFAAINGNERTGCIPLTVRFFNNTSGATSFGWNFSDGGVLNTYKNIDTVVHTFNTPGNYNVRIQATNGCSDTSTMIPIQVFASPHAAFTLPPTACVNESVTIVNQTDTATSITWSLGDGSTSHLQSPAHPFATAGTYQITLIAALQYAAGNTCYDSATRPIIIGPSGTLQYDHGYICGNKEVHFEITDTNSDSIRWNFGDGTTLSTTSREVYHRYQQSGNYLPSVTLQKGSACAITIHPMDTIKVDYVTAGFITRIQQLCDSILVTFTDTSRAYSGIRGREWQPGNNNIFTTPGIKVAYTTTGNYPVVLSINANSGCTATFNQSLPVKVNNTPAANIAAVAEGCTQQAVTYTALTSPADSISLYQWSFSGNTTSAGASHQHTYSTAGTYTTRLIVGTVAGCYDTATHSIIIKPSPTVTAGADELICKGKQVALSVTGANSYNWSPIDGSLSCVNCTNPVASPVQTTLYKVKGTGINGCSVSDSVLVTVAQPIQIEISGIDTICTGSQSQLSVTGATSYQWTPTATIDAPTSSHPVVKPAFTTLYQVIGFDAHQCFQDTATIQVVVGDYPIISLGKDTVMATGSLYPLNTVVVNGPIKQWQWSPADNLSCTNCAVPVATIKNNICYQVTATNIYGCRAADTMCIKVFCEGTQVFIPNMFTPDNDGHNDKLIVRGKGIAKVKAFLIFNRWGQLVFERSNFLPNDAGFGWDGSVKGIPAPPDVYVYTCEVVCENGVTYTYKGNVAIIK